MITLKYQFIPTFSKTKVKTYIPGDALLGKARREIRGDGGAPLLGSNDLRDKSGDAVLFWRDMFGTGCNPLQVISRVMIDGGAAICGFQNHDQE